MIKRIWLIIFCAISLPGISQSLAGLNYRYLYDPANEINFPIKAVNDHNQITVYFNLQITTTQDRAKDFTITWERRESWIQREGTPIKATDSVTLAGNFSLPVPEKPWLLVARILNSGTNKRWTYSQIIDAKYPVDGYLEDENGIVFLPYIKAGKEVTVRGAQAEKSVHFFFYKTDFQPALPPFADKQPAPDRFLFADSSFNVANGAKVVLKTEGLYLAQQDTAAAQGFSIRVVSATYPKYTRVIDIPAPLVFVSTKEEQDELLDANGDKAKVDKVILDITGARDRAKDFMKSYFRRVELTNLYFTSYKEGWKTDRGMIFLIFGLPEEVSRNGGNEVWVYKNLKERFTFIKSGSVYNPERYTLMRNSKMAATWYSTVDLWRKSQF